jgi:pyrimidine operon attenuation protein / uracil phosphoribosyltransferase
VCEFCERELKIEFVGHARTRRYYRFDRNLYGYVRSWIEESSLAVFESVKQAEESGYEPYRRGPQREIMNADEVAAACRALAAQMAADLPDLASVTIVGVVSHGAMLALRLRDLIEAETRVRMPCAALDVFGGEAAFHPLDDGGPLELQIEGQIEVKDRTIVLVDDVINSGWTVQRAMTAIWQCGRPAAVKLAVLIDRGHRAVPIRPNYVGKNIPTARAERVQVRLAAPEGAVPGRAKAQDRVLVYSMVESLKEGEKAE